MSDTPGVEQFRRGKFRLAIFWILIVTAWIASAGMALVAVALIPQKDWGTVAISLSSTLGLAAGAVQMHGWLKGFSKHWLIIDDAGVRGRLRSGGVNLKWRSIRSVAKGRKDLFVIQLLDGGAIPFTGVDIPRPGRAAHAIAERLYAPIQQLTPHD
jgi:hypothetical protein